MNITLTRENISQISMQLADAAVYDFEDEICLSRSELRDEIFANLCRFFSDLIDNNRDDSVLNPHLVTFVRHSKEGVYLHLFNGVTSTWYFVSKSNFEGLDIKPGDVVVLDCSGFLVDKVNLPLHFECEIKKRGNYMFAVSGSREFPVDESIRHLVSSEVKIDDQYLSPSLLDRFKFRPYSVENIHVMDTVKPLIKRIEVLLDDPERFDRYNVKKIITALFEGPPGTGKTMHISFINELIKSRASKAESLCLDCGKVLSKWFGEPENTIRDFFETCDTLVKQGYFVLVILDEVEALIPHRGVDPAGHMDRVVGTFLGYSDWFINRSKNSPVVILSSTNHSDLLDFAAVRRLAQHRILFTGLSMSEVSGILLSHKCDRKFVMEFRDLVKKSSLRNKRVNPDRLVRALDRVRYEAMLEEKPVEPKALLDTYLSLDVVESKAGTETTGKGSWPSK